MRARKQGDERSDAAAQTEDRVPLHPGLPLEDEILERPAEVSDDPEADANRERVPEQALAPGPFGTTPQDDHADADRWQEEADHAEDRPRKGVVPQEPPQRRVRQHVAKADQIHHAPHRILDGWSRPVKFREH